MRFFCQHSIKSFFQILFLCYFIITPAFAGEYAITTWQIPGEGPPTLMQYLDGHTPTSKPAANLASSTDKGDVVYSYPLELPPAILQPALALAYSSEGGLDLEMVHGWRLEGIAEIRRPLARAFVTKGKEDWVSAEWLVSGPGFSGTLQPSGKNDFRFLMRTDSPTYVVAEYTEANNTWKIYHNGTTYALTATDNGRYTDAGTERWRVTRTTDSAGNYINYNYRDDGSIDYFTYGGSLTSGEDPI